MPVFNSSDSSSSSGHVPIFDADEIGKRLKLDSKTVDWLKKEPVNENDLILVLSYQNAFLNLGNFDINKQAVSNALINLGATLVSDNVFKFDDWSTMYAARDNMMANMIWYFYTFNPILAQRIGLNIGQQPTITTTAIVWNPEITGKLTINPYEFFKL